MTDTLIINSGLARTDEATETASEAVSEYSMVITKANIDKNGVMRWRSVNSDIEKDYYGERMSKELFQDFIKHIQNEDDIPEPFKSVIAESDWDGGMPYVSIAHFKSGTGRRNVPGEPSSIYMDGNALKSTGVMYDTPLGRAVFKSIQKDLVEKRDDKVRISIGFLDLEHSHGDKFTFTRKSLTDKCPLCKKGVGDKIYKKGHLVHLALTRVPANPRTDVEVEKSMTTKREDAESIIADEEIIKGMDLKSLAEGALVIKAKDMKDMDEDCEDDESKKKKKDMEMKEASVSEPVAPVVLEAPVVENSVFSPVPEPVTETVTPAPVYAESVVDRTFSILKSRVEAIKSQGLTGEAALKELQPDFDRIGEVLRAEFTPAPTPEQVAAQTLESTLRSLLSEMLPQALAQTVAPIQSKLDSLEGELRAKSLTAPVRKEQVETVTVQRSIQPNIVQKAALDNLTKKAVSQFDLIARQSVGL